MDPLSQFEKSLEEMRAGGYTVCGFYVQTDGSPVTFSTVEIRHASPLISVWAGCMAESLVRDNAKVCDT